MSAPVFSSEYAQWLDAAAHIVLTRLGRPFLALALGSGLGGIADLLRDRVAVSYADIPHFPKPSVAGHSGELVFGYMGAVPVLCFSGRSHGYEGHHALEVTFGARVAHRAGCRIFIATNASGGCAPGMHPGSVSMIGNHINFTRTDFLRDVFGDERVGHMDLSWDNAFDTTEFECAQKYANKVGLDFFLGNYCGTPGPAYETPHEVLAGVAANGCLFGMSTVPEVTVARSLGLRVLGFSLVTNFAAGFGGDSHINHDEVKSVANDAGPRFQRMMLEFVADVGERAMREAGFGAADDAAAAQHRTKRVRGAGSATSAAAPASTLSGFSAPSQCTMPVPNVRVCTPFEPAAVHQAVAHLRSLSLAVPQLAVFVPGTFAATLRNMHGDDARWISYAELPGAPLVGAFAAQLSLVFAPTFGEMHVPVALLVSDSVDGVHPTEASFLTCVLHSLGCSRILCAVVPQHVPVGAANAVRAITSVTSPPANVPAPAPKSLHVFSHADVLDSPLTDVLVEHLNHGVQHATGLFTTQGPTPVTSAERDMAANAGCPFTVAQHVAAVYTALEIGCEGAVVALHGRASRFRDLEDVVRAVLRLSPPASSASTTSAAAVNSPARRSNSVVSLPALVPNGPVRVSPKAHAEQADSEFVARLAHDMSAAFKRSVKWSKVPAIVMPLALSAQLLDAFEVLAQFEWHDEANSRMHQFKLVQRPASKDVALCIIGGAEARSDLDLGRSTAPLRVLKHLGVPRVLLASSVLAADDASDAAAGAADGNGAVANGNGSAKAKGRGAAAKSASASAAQFVVLDDHINLTGLSGLYGHNVEAFGPRFFDMRLAYEPSLRQAIRARVPSLGAAKPVVVATHAFIKSAGERALAKTLGATHVSLHFALDNAVLHQAGVPCAAVGIVKSVGAQAHAVDIDQSVWTSVFEAFAAAK